jgi:Tol biopolymer transport system component
MKKHAAVWIPLACVICIVTIFAVTGEPGPEFGPVAFSPDGQHIVFPYSKGKTTHLFRAALTDGHASRLRNSDCGQEYDPDFSPSGDAIVFSCSGHIYLWEKNASQARSLIPSDGKDTFPRFSPDGQRVYFARYGYYGSYSPIAQPHAHEWDVFVIDVADKTVHPVTNENFYGIGELSISPDGKEMLVSTLDKGIRVYSTNGGAMLRAFNPPVKSVSSFPNSELIVDGQYTRDGGAILFMFPSEGTDGFDYDVYAVNLKTETLEKLTTRNGYSTGLRVSPDGKSAMFVKWSKNWHGKPIRPALYILNLETRELRKLNISFKDSGH